MTAEIDAGRRQTLYGQGLEMQPLVVYSTDESLQSAAVTADVLPAAGVTINGLYTDVG